MANRNKVPTKASAPLTGARKRKYDEERMMEERRRNTPKLERRDPRNVPAMTRAQYRELMGGKGGTGDPDAMLGERMNPLVEAIMFSSGGLPATVKSTLGAAGLTVGTMAGFEKLAESNPRMANLVNLGLLALSVPGIAASARRAGIKQLNDLISEPTEQKLNLLGEMLKYHKKKHNLNGVDDKTIDLALKGAIWELDERRPQAQKDVQYQWQVKNGRYVPDSEATIIAPEEPGAYDKLVNALKRSTFAVPITGVGLSLGTQGSEDERETQQAAEGGDTEGPDGAPVETPMEVPAGAPVPEGGPRIVINPEVFEDKRDALCVAMNEAFRVLMEVNGFNPVSEPTDAQRQFFADTAYSQNENQMRRTILARICTFDTSVKDPTEEQLEESVEFLEAVMEMGAPQNEWEQQAVQRIHDVLVAAIEKGTSVGDTPTEEPPAPEDVQEGDPRGEQAAVGGGVSDKDLDKIGQGKGGHFQNQRGQTVAAWNNTARDSAGRIVRRDSAQQTNNAAGQAGGNPAKPPEEPNEFVAQFLAGEAGGNPAKPPEEPNEFVLYNQDSSIVENDTHSQGERETFLKERGMDTELAKTATMDQLIALHTKQVEDGVAPSGSTDEEEEIG